MKNRRYAICSVRQNRLKWGVAEKENIADINNVRSQRYRVWLFWLMSVWAGFIFVSILVYVRTHPGEFLTQISSSMGKMLAVFAVGMAIERMVPAERQQPVRDLALNIGSSFLLQCIIALQAPLFAVGAVFLMNRIGLGFITLPVHGWLIVPSALLYLFTMDFMEYTMHRAQHAFPFLWAMHSFHHSDRAVNVTTTFRHFWFERVLHQIIVVLPVAILFNAPPVLLLIYGLSCMIDYFTHMNVRLSMGPAWGWYAGRNITVFITPASRSIGIGTLPLTFRSLIFSSARSTVRSPANSRPPGLIMKYRQALRIACSGPFVPR